MAHLPVRLRLAKRALSLGFALAVLGAARTRAGTTSPCLASPVNGDGNAPAIPCTATPTSPTPTPTSTQTQTQTLTNTPPPTPPTVTPTTTMPPTRSPSPSPTKSASKTASPTASPTKAQTASPTATPSATRTANPTKTSTATVTQTPTPTPAPRTPTRTPTYTPRTYTPTPTPTDPCADTDPVEPPGIAKAKRYAVGITETNRDHPWKGASVEWTNQEMWVPPPPPKGQFVDETLWVGTTNSDICWVEVGDSEHYDKKTGISSRNYYWAENSKANGYHEFNLKGPAYPPVGAYQTYTIYLDPDRAAYEIVIGITNVGESIQPGDTIYANVGLETTTSRARILVPVRFRNFQIYDGRAYWPWPNHSLTVDSPAWWLWTWPTASNGIPFPFPF